MTPPVEQSVDSVIDGLGAVVWEADLETGDVLFISEAATELLGYPVSAWRDREFVRRVLHPGDLREAIAAIAEARRSGAPARVDVRILRADRQWLWTRTVVTAVLVLGGRHRLRGVTLDVTAEKRDEAELLRRASVDALTGVVNRAAFEETLDRAIGTGEPFALLMIDLDDFKSINDKRGHSAGDDVLRTVGHRLRATGGPFVVGRLGGDEFILLVPEAGHSAALELAARVQESLSQPIDCGAGRLSVGASIGISLFPDHGTRSPVLLRCADAAMYRSKRMHDHPPIVWEGGAVPPPGRLSRRRVGRGMLLGCIAFSLMCGAPALAAIVSGLGHLEHARSASGPAQQPAGSLDQLVSELLSSERAVSGSLASPSASGSALEALLLRYGVAPERLDEITEAVARRLVQRIEEAAAKVEEAEAREVPQPSPGDGQEPVGAEPEAEVEPSAPTEPPPAETEPSVPPVAPSSDG